MAGVTNTQLCKEIEALGKRLDTFVEQYETDMRGDKTLNNGNRGVVGTVRATRAELASLQVSVTANHDAIFGSDQNPEERGLIQMAKDNEKLSKANKASIDEYNAGIKKIAWLVITSLIGGGGLGWLFTQLATAPHP